MTSAQVAEASVTTVLFITTPPIRTTDTPRLKPFTINANEEFIPVVLFVYLNSTNDFSPF